MRVSARGRVVMGRWGRAFAAGTLLLTVIAAQGLATSASATTPGVNGRISFMRTDDNGHWQIWTANPDLTRQDKLTDGDYDNGWATWSPDGTRLAFDSARLAPEANGDLKEIFTMAADGTDVRQVTSLGFSAGLPTWSKNGRWIAFTTDGANYPKTQGIYVIHPDGTGLRRVVALPPGARAEWLDAPRFSPDGSQLAYTFFEVTSKGEESSLWVVNLDGTNAHRLVAPGRSVGDSDWSPDGRYLIFEQVPNTPDAISRVLRVPATGGRITALTHDRGYREGPNGNWSFEASFDPVYSPDGTKILYSHDEYSPEAGCTSLRVMKSDGSHQRWLNNDCLQEHQVDWGTAPLH